ncbi:MAG: HlyD family efflux transporter periplasmic adaptor subunit [Planctomycetes bacterium]|jgi:multidrug efflux pump subunit AcrA (membrane-fusion protein)|nr:HlyD family efflux transporter periplasmic adaptor subunit [Phycisphaerae bacterium]NBB95661.1 HlyD family efflux transporter periplasmic adaptor subunit [Planctomycetota bacterium]
MIRKLIVSMILVALLVGGGSWAAWYFITHRPPAKQRPVRSMAPRVVAPRAEARIDYQVELIGYGTVRPKVQPEISPQVGGEIDFRSESFLSGRMVRGPVGDKPGEVLFRIDSERYELAVKNAQQQIEVLTTRLNRLDREEKNLEAMKSIASEQLTLDKKELERYQQLLAEDASTENEVEQATSRLLSTRRSLQDIQNQLALIPDRRAELQAEIAASRVKRMQAQLDLRYATYHAPVTGRIISSKVDQGDYVQPGTVCGEMYGTEVMELPVSILAGDLRWIDRQAVESGGIPATVSWSEPGNGESHTWSGRVERIEAGLEAQTRMARLVVLVDNVAHGKANPDAAMMLDINMYCRVSIRGRTVPKAFLLPRSAIVGGSKVYVASPRISEVTETETEGNRTTSVSTTDVGYVLDVREVRVTRYTDGQAMILPDNGIQAGDRVILSPVPKPVEGMRIDVADAPATDTDNGTAR